MDKQEKELEEILRMFDKEPSPSAENSAQNQTQQNNKQHLQLYRANQYLDSCRRK